MIQSLHRIFELSHGDHRTNRPMEGVRGFAVLLVFLVHYVTLVLPWLDSNSLTFALATSIARMGHLGVDLFFVLSGYLIYGMLLAKPRPLGVYALRRVQRIYPTFAAVFGLYLLLSVLFPSESKIPAGVAGLWYVLQNALLLPGLFPIEPMITVAWSLSYEAGCYVAVPLMMGLFSMRSMPRRVRVCLLVGLSIVMFVVCGAWLGHVRLTMFVCGMLVYESVSAGGMRWLGRWGLGSLISGLGLAMIWPVLGLPVWGLFVVLFGVFFVFARCCLGGIGSVGGLFTLKPIRWLGNMSYSYYLIHGLALKAGFAALAWVLPASGERVWLFWWLLPAAWGVTLLPAVVLFVVVERPYSLVRRCRAESAQSSLPAPAAAA